MPRPRRASIIMGLLLHSPVPTPEMGSGNEATGGMVVVVVMGVCGCGK